MKILMCHNYYQQAGGEDQVFADESFLLQEHGHEVIQYVRHNKDVDDMSNVEKLRKTMWNPDTVVDLEPLIRRHAPPIMYCTNTFPLISPAAFDVARRYGVKVVQSIHNYRLVCPAATFFRAGKVCEDCMGKAIAIPGIKHACYRGKRRESAVVAMFEAYHRARKTYRNKVDRIIALTQFSKDKLIEGGIPADKMVVKTNFVHPDPGIGKGQGEYALFVGRLSDEKGVRSLVECWKSNADLPRLRIVGDGPLGPEVKAASDQLEHLDWEGRQPLSRVYELLGDAKCLIVPSICYEVCPKAILEAYAKSTPVVASRLGGMAELVGHERTGFLFEPGSPVELAKAVRKIFDNPDLTETLRRNARKEYEALYTAERNYNQLIGIFESALA